MTGLEIATYLTAASTLSYALLKAFSKPQLKYMTIPLDNEPKADPRGVVVNVRESIGIQIGIENRSVILGLGAENVIISLRANGKILSPKIYTHLVYEIKKSEGDEFIIVVPSFPPAAKMKIEVWCHAGELVEKQEGVLASLDICHSRGFAKTVEELKYAK